MKPGSLFKLPKLAEENPAGAGGGGYAWAAWFYLLNTALMLLAALRYLPHMRTLGEPGAGIYLALAAFGHFHLLSLLFLGLPLLLITAAVRRPLPPRVFGILLSTILLVTLLVDTAVYDSYRFHLRGFVFELILGGAGGEIFDFPLSTIALAAVFVLAVAALEYLAARAALSLSRRPNSGKTAFAVTLAALGSLLAAQLTHIWADANYYAPITSLTRHLPLYQAATAKRFLADRGWLDLDETRKNAQTKWKASGCALAYPAAPLAFKAPEKPLNLLIIVIDCWRRDTFSAEVTPNLYQFSNNQGVERYFNHFSGGNSTAAGIFSLFYGIPGSYYQSFAAEQAPPVLMQTLKERGYRMGIFSSAKITSPPFDRTVFAGIENLRLSTEGDRAWVRDRRLTDEWKAFLSDGNGRSPFFGFLFYDTPHAYQPPPDYPRPFLPVAAKMDYLDADRDAHRTEIFNLFKTAVHYSDSLIGEVLGDLKAKGLLENTVVLVTGDHAEEFNDSGKGYWGHLANYSVHQTGVPLLLHWPGAAGGDFTHPTSHLDVAPTLMEGALGAVSPPESYSSGRKLKDSKAGEGIVMASYIDYALVTPSTIVRFSPDGATEATDGNLNPLPDFRLSKERAEYVLREVSRFYR